MKSHDYSRWLPPLMKEKGHFPKSKQGKYNYNLLLIEHYKYNNHNMDMDTFSFAVQFLFSDFLN